MFSIRKNRQIICLAIGALTLGGCVSAHRQDSPPVAGVEPIAPDEAMQKREWPQQVAAYPNGSVAAGPTEFNYEPKRGMPNWQYAYADSATFFANMVMLPYNLIAHPQSGVKIAKGETVGPTYTAMPVLPPPLVYQPSTPPVEEPGGFTPVTPPVAEPTTPPVVEPPTTPATEVTPPTSEVTPPAAPVETIPSIAPQPGTSPTPVVSPTTDTIPTIAPPVAEPTAPAAPAAPAPAAPAPPPDITISPGVAPTTPTVIEPPPPEATKNLAPAIHPMQESAPTTQSDLNK